MSAFSLRGEWLGKMEEGRVYSWDGVFSHLEMLEAQAHEADRKQEEKKQQEEKLASLKERVEELRIQRDRLQAKVDLQKKRQSGKEGIVSDAAEPSAGAVLEWKIRSVKGMLQLFYLTGISGKLTKQGVCFSISTAYESTYLDSYHLDLLTKPAVRIHRHSVPVFIPLEQIAQRHLQTDIRRFLSVLSDHLNAYASRKYQADQLQERFSDQLEGSLQRNSLCNLLAFNYKVPSGGKTFPFSARLIYRDICCSLPTEVMVSCTVKAPEHLEETAAAHSELFRHMALHKAFCTFTSTEEKVDGAP